jgi:hypothetical protein
MAHNIYIEQGGGGGGGVFVEMKGFCGIVSVQTVFKWTIWHWSWWNMELIVTIFCTYILYNIL